MRHFSLHKTYPLKTLPKLPPPAIDQHSTTLCAYLVRIPMHVCFVYNVSGSTAPPLPKTAAITDGCSQSRSSTSAVRFSSSYSVSRTEWNATNSAQQRILPSGLSVSVDSSLPKRRPVYDPDGTAEPSISLSSRKSVFSISIFQRSSQSEAGRLPERSVNKVPYGKQLAV